MDNFDIALKGLEVFFSDVHHFALITSIFLCVLLLIKIYFEDWFKNWIGEDDNNKDLENNLNKGK